MSRPRDSTGQRGETISTRQNGTKAQDGLGNGRPAGAAAPRTRRAEMVTRVAAGGSLLAAIVLVVLVLFDSGSTYTIRANFLDAGGLVTGDDVLIGPARVGSVKSIGLTPDGQAQVVMGLDSSVAQLPQGTVARIYENSLSGIANKYVVLEPGTGVGQRSPMAA